MNHLSHHGAKRDAMCFSFGTFLKKELRLIGAALQGLGASAKLCFATKFANFVRKARTRDEAVSGTDTARSAERFVAKVCKLQSKDSFAEVP